MITKNIIIKSETISIKKQYYFNLPYSVLTMKEAIEVICDIAENSKQQMIFTPNVQHFYIYKKDSVFRNAYNNAAVSLVDGMPLVWGINFCNNEKIEKISGSDIFIKLFEKSIDANLRIFILGGLPGVAESAIKILGYGDLINKKIFYHSPPLNFEKTKDNNEVINAINAVRPHLLFVALGAPKQELWIYDNIKKLDVNVAMGIGGSVDFVAGVQKRAPKWMQRTGLEWFYRLCKDPKRLWKRYFVTNLFYMPYLLFALVRRLFLNLVRKR